jgi:oligopeptide transport system substrate-binding protein
MFNNRVVRALPIVALVAAIAFTGSLTTVNAASVDNAIVLTSPMVQDTEPITAYLATTVEMTTLDPQLAEDETAIGPIENLFLGLTDVDPKTQEVRPEMATKWETKDGVTWEFTIRNDVNWVNWDPTAKKATKLGVVTAKDFEYGIKRACDPRLGSYYGKIAASAIAGCDVINGMKVEDFKETDLDKVEVKALSDTQLEIKLQANLPYFESMTPMWMLRAVPKDTIEKFGEDWIQPGNIVTNGNFMLDTWNKGVNRIFVKNPYMPADFQNNYGGNLERMYVIVVKDGNTIYSQFQNNQVDAAGVPRGEQQKILSDPELSKQIVRNYDLVVGYFGFAYDKPPFDNVHARRAFSAIIDRKTMVQDLIGGRGAPMAHFMPPGIFGSVAINEVGVGDPKNLGFDPEYAKKEFEAAGYTDCSTFPVITVITEDSSYAEYLQNQAKTHLGCDASKITIQQAEFQVKEQAIKADQPTAQRPNVWLSFWGPDYLDAQNWMHDVLSCKVDNSFKRPCGPLDEAIDAASRELDSDKRAEAYRKLEESFFAADGEFTIAPLYTRLILSMFKPWYKGLFDTDALLGGGHWETRRIDQAAQLAARGGANKAPETPVPAETEAAPSA